MIAVKHLGHSLRKLFAVTTVALAACAAPTAIASAGPPGRTVQIGVLGQIDPTFDPALNPFARELVAGLRELGYAPGRNFVFEYKSAQGNSAALPGLATD